MPGVRDRDERPCSATRRPLAGPDDRRDSRLRSNAMSDRHRLPERLSDSVRDELERLDPGSGGTALTELLARWPGAVGDVVARNAWPARRTRDGIVLVHTSSS